MKTSLGFKTSLGQGLSPSSFAQRFGHEPAPKQTDWTMAEPQSLDTLRHSQKLASLHPLLEKPLLSRGTGPSLLETVRQEKEAEKRSFKIDSSPAILLLTLLGGIPGISFLEKSADLRIHVHEIQLNTQLPSDEKKVHIDNYRDQFREDTSLHRFLFKVTGMIMLCFGTCAAFELQKLRHIQKKAALLAREGLHLKVSEKPEDQRLVEIINHQIDSQCDVLSNTMRRLYEENSEVNARWQVAGFNRASDLPSREGIRQLFTYYAYQQELFEQHSHQAPNKLPYENQPVSEIAFLENLDGLLSFAIHSHQLFSYTEPFLFTTEDDQRKECFKILALNPIQRAQQESASRRKPLLELIQEELKLKNQRTAVIQQYDQAVALGNRQALETHHQEITALLEALKVNAEKIIRVIETLPQAKDYALSHPSHIEKAIEQKLLLDTIHRILAEEQKKAQLKTQQALLFRALDTDESSKASLHQSQQSQPLRTVHEKALASS